MAARACAYLAGCARAAMTAPVLAPAVLPSMADSAVQASPGSQARMISVSCAPGGGCAAGGEYFDASFHAGAFVLTEGDGQWGTAIEVPGLAALSPKNPNISSVSSARCRVLDRETAQPAVASQHSW